MGKIVSRQEAKDFSPITDWLFKKGGNLVFGGHLWHEYCGGHVVADLAPGKPEPGETSRVKLFIKSLFQSGRAIQIGQKDVLKEQRVVVEIGICRSNDTHVIALARLSGARTLVTSPESNKNPTGDKLLQIDFKNRQLINNPKGSIYKNRTHRKLLQHTRACKNLTTRLQMR